MTKISAAEKMLTVEDLCGYLGVSKDYIHTGGGAGVVIRAFFRGGKG